ncbi:DUF4199 family protein [Dyella sp. LX-66]|uniref:DUF4199 domain-containing protein n=1 Tax=Dyella TaxID=231454 RepID=UPI00144780B5|nr:DUF4199 family protein [Dyella sp. LX-1]MBT2139868.1 DUF4199 family protein [Dyella sp. LX-66]NKJ22367.1 hypothetical protein [Dyella sp. SG609]
MLRTILKYGLIAGLVVGGFELATFVLFSGMPPLKYGMVVGYTTMLIALSAVFVGIKRHRDVDRGGVIGFWPALGVGLGISFIAGIFYVAAWEAVQSMMHMDFASSYAQAIIASQKAKGASAEALAKLTTEMEAFKVQYANPMYRLPMTFAEIFPIGVLVSLVSAGLLRNSRFLAVRRG